MTLLLLTAETAVCFTEPLPHPIKDLGFKTIKTSTQAFPSVDFFYRS